MFRKRAIRVDLLQISRRLNTDTMKDTLENAELQIGWLGFTPHVDHCHKRGMLLRTNPLNGARPTSMSSPPSTNSMTKKRLAEDIENTRQLHVPGCQPSASHASKRMQTLAGLSKVSCTSYRDTT